MGVKSGDLEVLSVQADVADVADVTKVSAPKQERGSAERRRKRCRQPKGHVLELFIEGIRHVFRMRSCRKGKNVDGSGRN